MPAPCSQRRRHASCAGRRRRGSHAARPAGSRVSGEAGWRSAIAGVWPAENAPHDAPAACFVERPDWPIVSIDASWRGRPERSIGAVLKTPIATPESSPALAPLNAASAGTEPNCRTPAVNASPAASARIRCRRCGECTPDAPCGRRRREHGPRARQGTSRFAKSGQAGDTDVGVPGIERADAPDRPAPTGAADRRRAGRCGDGGGRWRCERCLPPAAS